MPLPDALASPPFSFAPMLLLRPARRRASCAAGPRSLLLRTRARAREMRRGPVRSAPSPPQLRRLRLLLLCPRARAREMRRWPAVDADSPPPPRWFPHRARARRSACSLLLPLGLAVTLLLLFLIHGEKLNAN
uniref:Uncharacterized protein n=1 Tax=Oryza meridionalis TaxID=40149 RepID=A0A0E0D3L5_9ORYZ